MHRIFHFFLGVSFFLSPTLESADNPRGKDQPGRKTTVLAKVIAEGIIKKEALLTAIEEEDGEKLNQIYKILGREEMETLLSELKEDNASIVEILTKILTSETTENSTKNSESSDDLEYNDIFFGDYDLDPDYLWSDYQPTFSPSKEKKDFDLQKQKKRTESFLQNLLELLQGGEDIEDALRVRIKDADTLIIDDKGKDLLLDTLRKILKLNKKNSNDCISALLKKTCIHEIDALVPIIVLLKEEEHIKLALTATKSSKKTDYNEEIIISIMNVIFNHEFITIRQKIDMLSIFLDKNCFCSSLFISVFNFVSDISVKNHEVIELMKFTFENTQKCQHENMPDEKNGTEFFSQALNDFISMDKEHFSTSTFKVLIVRLYMFAQKFGEKWIENFLLDHVDIIDLNEEKSAFEDHEGEYNSLMHMFLHTALDERTCSIKNSFDECFFNVEEKNKEFKELSLEDRTYDDRIEAILNDMKGSLREAQKVIKTRNIETKFEDIIKFTEACGIKSPLGNTSYERLRTLEDLYQSKVAPKEKESLEHLHKLELKKIEAIQELFLIINEYYIKKECKFIGAHCHLEGWVNALKDKASKDNSVHDIEPNSFKRLEQVLHQCSGDISITLDHVGNKNQMGCNNCMKLAHKMLSPMMETLKNIKRIYEIYEKAYIEHHTSFENYQQPRNEEFCHDIKTLERSIDWLRGIMSSIKES